MLFSSIPFLYTFLPCVLILYFLVPGWLKNTVLLLSSLFFYAWGEPRFVVFMVIAIVQGYVFGLLAEKFRDRPKRAKLCLWASAVVSLGLLCYCKYADFFISGFNTLTGLSLPLLHVALPIGISFYTFQILSYVIDVYRRDARVQKNIAAFGTYVTLFPQLIAGPIVRYADVDDQLRERTHSLTLFASGCRTFICGLAKKILLANAAGAMWNSLSAAAEPDALGAWLAIVFYTFQIYFDFSGYSDMAIGLGKMFGFSFRENFYYPYVSESITEFWRRWHISLSTWFREYVYIPLGGNRRGVGRTYFNLFCVWLLTGLWHGASWNFVLWGLYYFALLVIEKTFLLRLLERAPKFLRHIYSMAAVIFGWLLFVIEDVFSIGAYLSRMFGGTGVFATQITVYELVRNLVFLAILILASTPAPKKLWYKLYSKGTPWRIVQSVVCAIAFVLCIAYLVDSSYNPFLYFRF